MLKKIRYSKDLAYFISLSGLLGDNLIEPSTNMKWYEGLNLFGMLENMKAYYRYIEKPLRFILSSVKLVVGGMWKVFIGTVKYGVLKVGTRVIISPYNKSYIVTSIQKFHETIKEVFPGDYVGITLR